MLLYILLITNALNIIDVVRTKSKIQLNIGMMYVP